MNENDEHDHDETKMNEKGGERETSTSTHITSNIGH